MAFIDELTSQLHKFSNSEDAFHMHKYMRGIFLFYGVKTKERRDILKEVSANNKEELINNVRNLALELYKLPQRELHMCAMEIIHKELKKKYVEEDINLIETLITTNSWWDTVDFIAKQILGGYLLLYPHKTDAVITKFSNSGNMWLIRSTIIFQLGYKGNTNDELLFKQCSLHKESNEFFIQKAIGWALREYAKTNPKSVLNFVNSTHLKSLSQKEAIRNII